VSVWHRVDTRELGGSRNCYLDGFLHIVPYSTMVIHQIDIRCWCNPKVRWPDSGHTLIVSHRDKRPGRRGEVSPCPE
jgi:hypothetical protein